jgi:hypothetical protein
MAIEIINVGASPNDGNGDPIRDAFIKCNDNFDELDTTKIGGSGTDNFVPKFSGTDSIENSLIFDDGSFVGVNTTTPSTNLEVNGTDYSFSAGRQASNRKVSIGLNDNGQPSIQSFDSSNAPVNLTINPSGGNVGIGTLNPLYKFHVKTNTNGNIGFRNPTDFNAGWTTGSAFGVFNDADNANEKLYIETSQLGLNLTSQANTLIGGNVGIGTTSPLGILHLYKSGVTTRMVIDGDAGQSKIITYRTGGLQRFGMYLNNTAESGSNAGSDFQIRSYNDAGSLLSTPFFIKRSTGNVGIGTTSPSNKLDVNGNINVPSTNFFRYDGDTGLIGSATTIGGSSNQLGIRASNDILFATNGANERMRITSNGNVGIGTTSPGAKLQTNVAPSGFQDDGIRVTDGTRIIQTMIVGNLYNYRDVGPNETMLYSTGNPLNIVSDGQPIKFTAGTNERMRIDTSGNVAIGTTSPSDKLDVNGITSSRLGLNVGANSLGTDRMFQISGTAFTTGSSQFAIVNNPSMGSLTTLYGYYGGITATSATNSYAMYLETTSGTITNKYGVYQAGTSDKNYFAGNVGVGLTPNNWFSDFKVVQLGTSGGSIANDDWNGFTEILNNVYGSARNTYTRIQSLGATRYSQQFGTHAWFVSGSGSGGGTVSFTQAMTLNSSGNVGIGTTSPTSKLHVVGNTQLGNLYLNSNIEYNGSIGSDFYISTTQGGGIVYQADQNGHRFQTYLGAWLDRLIIADSGNVGIGTTSPTSKLHVVGLPEYATNALAIAGGLTVGAFYHTAGVLKVVI